MRHLKTYEGINYNDREFWMFIIRILKRIFFKEKNAQFFYIEYWNTRDGKIYGVLKIEYADTKIIGILKKIWRITEQKGKFHIKPITERRLGWSLDIEESSQLKILHNLLEYATEQEDIDEIERFIVDLDAKKYNL